MEDKSINAGKVGLTMGGDWKSSESYEKLTCVSHNGRSWAAKKNVSAGVEPSEANSAFWQLMSDRGVQGIQGPVGPQGNSAFDGIGVEIVNNLTQGGESAVLSAEQGKVLKTELTELESNIDNIKPIVINGDVTNAADEEDITSDNNLLKFKDRPALNGMGYVILRKNKTFAEQVKKDNTIYEVRYDYEVDGASLPANSKILLCGSTLTITKPLIFGEGTEVSGEGRLVYASDDAAVVMNTSTAFKGIDIHLPDGYNGSAILLSNQYLSKEGVATNVLVEDVEVHAPFNYGNLSAADGAVIEILSDSAYNKIGLWGCTFRSIKLNGCLKYFCKNWCKGEGWLSSMTFDDIVIFTTKYGFFGYTNEATIEDREYSDIQAMILNDVKYQSSGSSAAFAYFSSGSKTLSNCYVWDWTTDFDGTPIKLDSRIAGGNNKIFIDRTIQTLTHYISFPSYSDNLQESLVKGCVQCYSDIGQINKNISERNQKFYRKTTGIFSEIIRTGVVYYSAVGCAKETATPIFSIGLKGLKQTDLIIEGLHAGGAWYWAMQSTMDISSKIDVYIKCDKGVEKINGENYSIYYILLKFKDGVNQQYNYITEGFSNYDTTFEFEQVLSPDLSGYQQITAYREGGVYIPELPASWNPIASTSGAANHLAQKDGKLVYKSKLAVQEYIPKIRMGSVNVSSSDVSVEFATDIGTSAYFVAFTNGNDFVVKNKTSKGFVVSSSSYVGSTEWCVVAI